MEWIVARWLTFTATLVVCGCCTVALALVRGSATAAEARLRLTRATARTGMLAALVMIPASLMRLADQALALRSPGDPWGASLRALLGATTWGTGFVWQSAALVLTLASLGVATRAAQPARWVTLAAAGALALCVTPAWQGHAIGSEEYHALAVASDVAHVTGAALWLGSLLVLAWLGTAWPDGDGQVQPERASAADTHLALLVPLVPRVALPGAALLLGSGVVTSVLHLRSVEDLWLARWGQLVLLKAVLSLAVVTFGALNWRRLGRRMAAPGGTSALRRALLAELGLALLVLVVTAVLVATPLPGE